MFKNIKLDIKSIFIIILGAALILSFIFRPKKSIDTYENQIKVLHEENESLLNNNDSLKVVNIKLNDEVNKIMVIIENTKKKLDLTNKKIKELEDAKNKVSTHVDKLDADGISESLSEYLNRR